jgi:hypothetical protein
MGSFSRSGSAFQPDEIAILQQAFDAIWATLISHRPSQADNDELRTAISEKLCDIAASGITDVQLLRSLTLASLPLVMPVVPLPQDKSGPPEHEPSL